MWMWPCQAERSSAWLRSGMCTATEGSHSIGAGPPPHHRANGAAFVLQLRELVASGVGLDVLDVHQQPGDRARAAHRLELSHALGVGLELWQGERGKQLHDNCFSLQLGKVVNVTQKSMIPVGVGLGQEACMAAVASDC